MKRDYNESNELRRYVWRNYNYALTAREHSLYSAAVLELKARHMDSDSKAARYLQMRGYCYDADVAAIVESGLGAFAHPVCWPLPCAESGRNTENNA
jgi:hypothetical protein